MIIRSGLSGLGVTLLRSVSVNLAELRRAQTRFRALAGKDICSLCDKNIMQIPSINCCWIVFKLCFYDKISVIILSQNIPSFWVIEEQIVNVGMNSRQLELRYCRFNGGGQSRLHPVIKNRKLKI